MAADERQGTLLSLLDMAATLECVDHLILFQRPEVAVGIGNTALDWIRSFLSGRIGYTAVRVRRRAIGYAGGVARRSTGHGTQFD